MSEVLVVLIATGVPCGVGLYAFLQWLDRVRPRTPVVSAETIIKDIEQLRADLSSQIQQVAAKAHVKQTTRMRE